ncbi:MAG: response regulator transcription factor [Bacteroidota bacterium]
MEAKILFVDDERTFSSMTQEYLEAKGLQVVLVHASEEGLQRFKEDVFDLCILDIRMPMKDGYELAGELRVLSPQIPFIFLSGLHNKEQRIKGLAMGADDYITKPFSVEELYLRVRNILQRTKNDQPTQKHSIFRIGQYQFNETTHELIREKQTLKLTAIEAQLLGIFCERPNKLSNGRFFLRESGEMNKT